MPDNNVELIKPAQFGRIETAYLSEVTTEPKLQEYLANHPQILEAILEAPIDRIEIEYAVGGMYADLGIHVQQQTVLGEVQTGRSDSRHLGQVITYATVGEEHTLWLAAAFRREDLAVVKHFNSLHPSPIVTAIELTPIRVDGGRWAFTHRIVAGARSINIASNVPSERELAYQRYWDGFLGEVVHHTGLFSSHTPTRDKYLSTPAVAGEGIYYRLAVSAETTRVGLYIDGGDEHYNDKIFAHLKEYRKPLEAQMGRALDWLDSDGRRRRISLDVPGGYNLNPDRGIIAAIEALRRLQEAVTPILQTKRWNES